MIYDIIILIVGWLYPACASYNSLNADYTAQLAWMKYWIVMGLFTSCHFFTSTLISWLPCLRGLKLFFLCWLLPSLGAGSQLIHDEFVKPLLQRNKLVIVRSLESVSNIACNMLRELIKIIYHLSVDVVEQCWQMSRNADDMYVTPRLQAAINEVITELRIARCAATHIPFIVAEGTSHCHAVPQLKPETGTGAEQDATLQAVSKTDDAMKLRILLAEANSGERMQRCMKMCSQEHLAPISCCVKQNQRELQRPVKPNRNKRHASHLEQVESTANDAYSENRGYCDEDAQHT